MTETPSNPFQAFLDQSADWSKEMAPHMEKFMAGDWVNAMEKAMGSMTPDALDAILGATAKSGGLDAKTRLLITLAGLTAQGATAESQIRITVSNAVTAGATETEINETIATMSMIAGVPAMTKAMQLAKAVLDEKDATA